MGNFSSFCFPQLSPNSLYYGFFMCARLGLSFERRGATGYRLPATGYRLPATGYRKIRIAKIQRTQRVDAPSRRVFGKRRDAASIRDAATLNADPDRYAIGSGVLGVGRSVNEAANRANPERHRLGFRTATTHGWTFATLSLRNGLQTSYPSFYRFTVWSERLLQCPNRTGFTRFPAINRGGLSADYADFRGLETK